MERDPRDDDGGVTRKDGIALCMDANIYGASVAMGLPAGFDRGVYALALCS